jgi:hypothetical protein
LNSALRQKTDEERDLEIEQDKALFARVLAEIAPRGDMAQMPEPEQRKREWNIIAILVLSYAGAIAIVLGWLIAARMF